MGILSPQFNSQLQKLILLGENIQNKNTIINAVTSIRRCINYTSDVHARD